MVREGTVAAVAAVAAAAALVHHRPKFALYAIESAALTRKRNSSTAFKNSSGSSASDASFFRLYMHDVRRGAVR